MKRLVSVVLVTWNSAATLRRCLEGIHSQSWQPLELIAVDNASVDESVSIVQQVFPEATVLRNDSNRGFSVAVNQAVAIARGEIIVLCNPDAFLTPSYIERIVAGFDALGPSYGSATGKLFRASGSALEPSQDIDSKGIRMTRSGRHLDIGQGEPDLGDEVAGLRSLDVGGSGLREVFGASGAAASFRRSFIADVTMDGEFLDEDFFSFREDADLAWRGRLFGWRAFYAPDAVGYHVRHVTPAARAQLSPVVNMHGVKNRFLLRIKNEGIGLALRNFPFELLRDVLVVGATLTIERTSLPALGWLWKNRHRVMAKRRAVQGRRTVSDRDLAAWFG